MSEERPDAITAHREISGSWDRKLRPTDEQMGLGHTLSSIAENRKEKKEIKR